MRGEPPEDRAIGHQDGKVIQAECSAPGLRHAWSSVQRYQWRVFAMRAKKYRISGGGVCTESEYLLVEHDGLPQITHLEVHGANVRRVGQTERRWRNAVRTRKRFDVLHRYASLLAASLLRNTVLDLTMNA